MSVALGLLESPKFIQMAGGVEGIRKFNARVEAEVGADAYIDTGPLLPSGKGALWSSVDGGIHPDLSGYRVLGRHLAAPLANILLSTTLARHGAGGPEAG